jgi:hypothetical protein
MTSLTDSELETLADTYLKYTYNSLIKSPFKTFNEFLTEVYRDPIVNTVYLEDRIGLGQIIHDYLAIPWKTQNSLKTKFTDLGKAAGAGRFPSKHAFLNVITNDVKSISASDFIKITVKTTAKSVKKVTDTAVNLAESATTGLAGLMRYAPYLIGIFGIATTVFFYAKAKKFSSNNR